jgi:predicted metal-dependent enzyme (double-stranded beta helix superfamily)
MGPSEVLLEARVADSTVTVVRYAPRQVIRPHAHGEEGLTVVLRGARPALRNGRCGRPAS